MAVLTESQNLPLSIEIDTRKGAGHPAKIDGTPAWSCSDEAVGTLDVAADGMSATFKSVAEGSCSVTVTVDADTGEGVSPLIGSLDIQVAADGAAIVTISAGTPVDQL